MTRKRIFITGATGTMGMAMLQTLATANFPVDVTALARPSKKNRRLLKQYIKHKEFNVIWGDMMNPNDIASGITNADYIFHFGGLVSPKADYYPKKTLEINVGSARIIADAVLNSGRADEICVIYIGSIAQLGDRRPPHHWGRTGDPCIPSINDAYALSKILAEREIVNRLPKWISFRQTGILSPQLINKGSDPITFHVPLSGVLEWTTAEDTGNLMVNVCTKPLPDNFLNHFYNIGSGQQYRLTNYEFEKEFMKALGCPAPEKIFESNWFALKNFHGQWWADSDRLEQLLPYRANTPLEEYFKQFRESLPFYYKLASLVPARLIRLAMKQVAMKRPLGPLYWRDTIINKPESPEAIDCQKKLETCFGSIQQMENIPDWNKLLPEIIEAVPEPYGNRRPPVYSDDKSLMNHGYDESKPENQLSLSDIKMKAAHENGECLSHEMIPGDLSTPLQWRCTKGHRFLANPALVLLGGHWCPQCLIEFTGVKCPKSIVDTISNYD